MKHFIFYLCLAHSFLLFSCKNISSAHSSESELNLQLVAITKDGNTFKKESANPENYNKVMLNDSILHIEVIEPLDYKIKIINEAPNQFKIVVSNEDFYYNVKTVDSVRKIYYWECIRSGIIDSDFTFYAISADNLKMLSNSNTNTYDAASLEKWYGIYCCASNDSLTEYDEIMDQCGWFQLNISPDSIIYKSGSCMVEDYPINDPGGIYINYKCTARSSATGDTLYVFFKEKNNNQGDVLDDDAKGTPCLSLFRIKDNYYGLSTVISESNKMSNTARNNTPSPYLFRKFTRNN